MTTKSEAEKKGRTPEQIAFDMRRIERALKKPLEAMLPPDDLTVTQWAEKHRKLSGETAAEPGPWRVSRTPYFKEPMDAFTDPNISDIIIVAAAQVGKSEMINNCIGYIIDQDPGSILFVQPTNTDAKEYSKMRIAPMIRDCPTLRRKVSEAKSRDSGNTILQKTYPGGILTLCGSIEAHALASKPIRYVFGDERDRWATSAGIEGDPWDLAKARQTTFYNAKAVQVSTPTVKGHSAIAAAYATGTMERWCSRCPHCGEYHETRWADIRYEYDEQRIDGQATYTVKSIYYICPSCGGVSSEREIKRAPARWVAENPDAYQQGKRSFWLNAFVSPWASWESIVLKFLQALGSSDKMQVVFNTCFGELWEDRGDLEDEGSFLSRREDYGTRDDGSPVELPDGVLVLTCGVDTQDDRLEFEILGHGHFGETWGIKKGVIMGRPDTNEVWDALDDVIDHTYTFADGIGLPVSITFVDEGGHFTQEVRQRCRARVSKSVFAVKGKGGPNVPYTAPPKQQKIVINKRVIGECWLYLLGVDAGKSIIMDNLKVKTIGKNYCHFPRRDDYGEGYFKGLLSERLSYDKDKKQPWVWVKIPGHERNEALDCRNYALAAFKTLPTNLDAIDRRLKELRGKAPTSNAAIVQIPKKSSPRKRTRKEIFEDW